MTGEPLVSIVVPARVGDRAQAGLLDEALASVGAQTWSRYEAIVVDDGSSYDIRRLVESHPRTRYIRRANGGTAAARNTGIAASRGSHFVFLDADDHLLPAALETGLQALADHPECRFAVGAREEMTYEGHPAPWPVPPLPVESWLYDLLLGCDWQLLPPSAAIFDRTAVETVGGFRDPWGADDLDFHLRVARRFSARCHPTPVTRYRRYPTSTSRDGTRMLRSIRTVYARQWSVVRHDPVGEAAFHRGLARQEAIFRDFLVENVSDRMRAHDWGHAVRAAAFLLLTNLRGM